MAAPSTPYKGLVKHVYKHCIMWEAQIRVDYCRLYLGLFRSPEEAALAYNDAAIKYFGEFASLNKIRQTRESIWGAVIEQRQ